VECVQLVISWIKVWKGNKCKLFAYQSMQTQLRKWIVYNINNDKFPLAPMGALAPGSAHASPSAQAPIDTSGIFFSSINFFAILGDSKHFSCFPKKNLKNWPPREQGGSRNFFLHPQSYFLCDLKPHGKFWNTKITPSGRKVTRRKREREKQNNAVNIGYLVLWQCMQATRAKNV
jgi:hypothetical protein